MHSTIKDTFIAKGIIEIQDIDKQSESTLKSFLKDLWVAGDVEKEIREKYVPKLVHLGLPESTFDSAFKSLVAHLATHLYLIENLNYQKYMPCQTKEGYITFNLRDEQEAFLKILDFTEVVKHKALPVNIYLKLKNLPQSSKYVAVRRNVDEKTGLAIHSAIELATETQTDFYELYWSIRTSESDVKKYINLEI